MNENNCRLMIMRGPAGSGKSTIASSLYHDSVASATYLLSADHYMHEKECDLSTPYIFRPELLSVNHTKVFANFCLVAGEIFLNKAIADGLIILDNTNIRWTDFAHYVAVAKRLKFQIEQIIPTTPWAFDPQELSERGTHNVPLATLQSMVKNFDSFDYVQRKIDE